MEKVRSGVEVRIILDPIYQKVFVNDQIVQDLRSAGAVVRYYVVSEEQSVPDQLIFRTHQKLMVVDGAEAITGGSNFGTRYLSENQWRDTNVKLSGPIVADIQAEFAATWQSLTNESLTDQTYFPTLNDTGSVNARYLMQKPADRVFEIDAAVLLAIRMASQKIVIETPYFNPPDWLADELIAKATDGVDISILTNSEQTIDQTPLYWAGALRFPSLIENGINIFLWNRGDRTLHSKVMAVDDFFAMISSYNFGYRSAIWDVENAVIFTQPEMVNAISSILNDDLSQPFIVNASPELIQTEYQSNQWMWNLTDDFHWLFKSEQ
jgi:cardiolipin synthase